MRLRDEDEARRPFLLAWTRWRRVHQATARRCHIARRARERAALHVQAVAPSLALGELTEAEWERVRPLLPPQRPPVGRPRHDHRTVLGGILWVLRTASPWREMPVRFGRWETAYARYRLWREQGLWPRIIDALGPAPGNPVVPAPGAGAGEVSL